MAGYPSEQDMIDMIRSLQERIKSLEARTIGHHLQDESTPLPQRAFLGFLGDGVVATDDATNDRTVVTVPGATGGGGSMTVQDEGTDLPAEPKLDFVGDGVTATDDGGGGRTVVTIPGTSGDDAPGSGLTWVDLTVHTGVTLDRHFPAQWASKGSAYFFRGILLLGSGYTLSDLAFDVPAGFDPGSYTDGVGGPILGGVVKANVNYFPNGGTVAWGATMSLSHGSPGQGAINVPGSSIPLPGAVTLEGLILYNRAALDPDGEVTDG